MGFCHAYAEGDVLQACQDLIQDQAEAQQAHEGENG
jgi:hypothetical protein